MTSHPNFVELDGRRIDTSSQEWIVICLARHICRMPNKVARLEFLAKMKWPAEEIKELERIIREEWKRMYPKKESKEVAAHEHA